MARTRLYMLAALAAGLLAAPISVRAAQRGNDNGNPSDLCLAAIGAAERHHYIRHGLLAVMAKVESGRPAPSAGALQPWPWTVDADGHGLFFASKAEAIAWSRQALDSGTATFLADVINLAIVRPIDVAALLISALAGDADAMRVCRVVIESQTRIVNAPKRLPMLCASCPRPLRKNAYTIAVALPHRAAPMKALGMAVCTHCATEPEAIKAKALDALRRLWPGLRSFAITHPGGCA
jgi:hypothetical protein